MPKSSPQRRNSFFSGFARSFDLTGTTKSALEKQSLKKNTFITSDVEAMKSDWKKLGSDFYSALDAYRNVKRKTGK